MSLDFSALDRLTAATGAQNESLEALHPNEEKNATQGEFTALDAKRHYIKLEADQYRAEKTAAMYREYQENIKRSEQLRAEITKGIQAGEDTHALLLKAIEAIGRMTGDKVFFEANKENLIFIYGALGNDTLITHRTQEVQERIKRLYTALELETEEAGRRRIENAIKAHRATLERLQMQRSAADE